MDHRRIVNSVVGGVVAAFVTAAATATDGMTLTGQDRGVSAYAFAPCGQDEDQASADGFESCDLHAAASVFCSIPNPPFPPWLYSGSGQASHYSDVSSTEFSYWGSASTQFGGASAWASSHFTVSFDIPMDYQFDLVGQMQTSCGGYYLYEAVRIAIRRGDGTPVLEALLDTPGSLSISEIVVLPPGTYEFSATASCLTLYGQYSAASSVNVNFRLHCSWDLNEDGDVFVTDLLMLLASWGPSADCPADFDGDGLVGVVDLLALIANFGPCPGVPCVWDVNGDGIVDQSDLQQVNDNFGPCDGCPEDINGDGMVNGQDAAAVATHFGPCP